MRIFMLILNSGKGEKGLRELRINIRLMTYVAASSFPLMSLIRLIILWVAVAERDR